MLVNLATSLATTEQFRPIILVPNAKAGLLTRLLDEKGIEWHDTPALHWFILAHIEDAAEYFKNAVAGAEIYEDCLRRVGADLVIVNTLTHLEGVIAAVRANVPFVLWVHGILDAGMLGRSEHLITISENLALKLARQVVCCSNWTKAFFEYRVPSNRLRTIHNWTQVPPEPTRRAGQTRFAALSTLEPNKGIDVLIKAVGLLRRRNVELDLFGDGSDRARYEQMVARLELKDRVRIHNRVTDVNRIYDQSLAVVFPSFVESFGMVVIESMARGTPVIASRIGGPREIIEDEVSGLLFEPGDIGQLANRMRRIMDGPDLVLNLARHGFERVKSNFDGSRALASFVEVLTDAFTTFQSYSSEDFELLDVMELAFARAEPAEAASWSKPGPSERSSDLESEHAHTPAYTAEQLRSLDEDPERVTARLDPAALASFSSNLEELFERRFLRGWARFADSPDPCELEAFIDGRFAGRFRADLKRGDLAHAGFRDPRRAFLFPIPSAYRDGENHVFEVRLAGSELQLNGSPAAYQTDKTAANSSAPDQPRSNFDGLLNGTVLGGWISAQDGVEIYELDAFADGSFIGRCRAESERPDLGAAADAGGRGLLFSRPRVLQDGRKHVFESQFSAESERPNLVAAGNSGRRGFLFPLPRVLLDGRKHVFEIRLSSTAEQLQNSPQSAVTAAVDQTPSKPISAGLGAWATRTFSMPGPSPDPIRRSWRKRRDGARAPLLIAIADAATPSTEIVLQQPLEEINRIYGIDYQLFFEGSRPNREALARADVLLIFDLTTSSAVETAEEATLLGIPIVYLLEVDLSKLGGEASVSRDAAYVRSKNIKTVSKLARRVATFSQAVHDELAFSTPHVVLLPASADLEFFDRLPQLFRPDRGASETRIGYAGTSAHATDTKLLEEALRSLMDNRSDVVVESVGQVLESLVAHPRYRAFPEVDGIRSFGRFLHSRRWTVGLAPLPPTSLQDDRHRVYAALEIAGVYGGFAYQESVVHEETGLLAPETSQGWQHSIERLIDNPSFHASIVRRARQHLREHYSLQAVSSQFYRLLTEVIEEPSILLVKKTEQTQLRALVALERQRLVHLRQTTNVKFEIDHLSRTDIIVIEAGASDVFHPLIGAARDLNCRIVTVVDLESDHTRATGAMSLSRQSAILQESDLLMAYGTDSSGDRTLLTISRATPSVVSHLSAPNWLENLAALARDPQLLAWSAQDVDVAWRQLKGFEDDLDAWRGVLRLLGFDLRDSTDPVVSRQEKVETRNPAAQGGQGARSGQPLESSALP